jgi:hypothetical protein
MSQTHYFQRCDSLESAASRSTLQLIARIGDHSAASASRFLTDLLGESVEMGAEIAFPRGGDDPVLDGSVIQRAFKLIVVTKIESTVSLDHLLRCAGSFGSEDQKLLLLLTREPVGHQGRVITGLMRASRPDVVFATATFGSVCDSLRGLFGVEGGPMAALVDGYRECCDEMDLFERTRVLLRIVPCGRVLDIAKRFGVYFQPSERASEPRSLVGLYADKRVQAVLEVRSVFDAQLADGRLTKKLVRGEDTDALDSSLREVIETVRTSYGRDISTGTRFFCGDVFDTDFRRSSPGELVGPRLVDLGRLVGGRSAAGEVAAALKGKEWV